jgi:ubiquinone/menaquinone biosynthesis C-methylase UbiE
VYPHVLQELLQKGVKTNTDRMLEVGCGTGNYINALQKASGTACWGIDPFEGMLTEASLKNSLS